MSEADAPSAIRPDQRPARRVLLKLSGEALLGESQAGIDSNTLHRIASDIADVSRKGIGVCLVVGGGNFIRGATISTSTAGIDRPTADHMGMLATVINSLAIQGALERIGVATRVQSAIPMPEVCEPYIRRRALRHLEKGRIIIFAGGTGSPFFTTDTAAVLRASEMGCDLLLKGTKVDGVYSDDPFRVADAQRFSHLSYRNVLRSELRVMDTSAIALAQDNHIPVIVFSIQTPGAFAEVLAGRGRSTLISEEG